MKQVSIYKQKWSCRLLMNGWIEVSTSDGEIIVCTWDCKFGRHLCRVHNASLAVKDNLVDIPVVKKIKVKIGKTKILKP